MPPGMAVPVLPSASPTDFIHSGSAAKVVDEIVAANASAAILKLERMLHLLLGNVASAGRPGDVTEVVKGRNAVRLRPHANCSRPADVIILLRDVELAIERDANRLSGKVHLQCMP